ncbi:ABC transporter substrate-binding protein [Motilimonas cestriensis]|uniref:ABC transporter substrate-binding protein n=1 Tax=Motilimonas cestriensis TaxID=2742685 RepID=A0ABS8WAK9_9GAMM|nr:ABC transporter substrate-binding protein [Motilimonas cestriensis]MCE2595137.1 ABC transporter substrate-binding protein [Motilimonas cestriensis]
MIKVATTLLGITLLAALLWWLVNGRAIGAFNLDTSEPVIRIAVSQTPLSSPFFIAKNKRLFSQQQLAVVLVPCFGGHKCMEMLLNHEVDFATASETVFMFNSFKQPDLRLISSFVESDNDVKLLTLSGGGIASLDQLEGKKVGVIKASASEFFLDSLLILNGIDSSLVERKYYKPAQLVEALLLTEVDAIAAWEPYGYELTNTVPEQVVQLPSRGVYNLSFNLIGLGEKGKQAESIPGILAALEQANLYLITHPKQSQTLVSEILGISFRQLNWSWQDYLFRLSLGNALLSNLHAQARWALDRQLIMGSEVPDFRAMFSKGKSLALIDEPLEER